MVELVVHTGSHGYRQTRCLMCRSRPDAGQSSSNGEVQAKGIRKVQQGKSTTDQDNAMTQE